jgi:2-succinyl-5-enolpyruvyl-6-hydroxy-3-cyclohexene-1-carboxylate synthase
MSASAANVNRVWAGLLLEELHRCGVRSVGVAPGSRSGPLAEAAADHGGFDLIVHPDERGLGFHMLGVALGSGCPAVVLTTSGTAVANLVPAMAEAHHAGVPLIALTADRPFELRMCGANQTTDQARIFGGRLRAAFEFPPPGEGMPPEAMLTAVDEAVRAAMSGTRGPVHLNCMFRDPPPAARPPRGLANWRKSGRPWVAVTPDPLPSGEASLDAALEVVATAGRGVVLAGRLSPADGDAVAALAGRLRWPLLPDLQSGLRLGAREPEVIAHADLALGGDRFADGAGCDTILQFGSGFVTRRFLGLAADARIARRVVVDPTPGRVDPGHRPGLRVSAAPGIFAEAMGHVLPAAAGPAQSLTAWQRASERIEKELARRFAAGTGVSEPGVAWTLSRLLRAGDAWFLGNSLPVRLAAAFASARGANAPVAANRGLSGIDGQVATAAGYARGARRPVTLLIGDLGLLHDLNSMALLRTARAPVIVVAVNNDGGGIFSLLPAAESSRHFERVFGAPHGLTFRAAAEMFGLAYAAPATLGGLAAAWRAAARGGRPCLIEVRARRAATARAVRSLQAAAARIADAGPS